MTTRELLSDLRKRGFQLTPLPGDRLEVRPFSKLPENLRDALRQHKTEVLALLSQQEKKSFSPSTRDFLSRPIGQEGNPDPWDAWAPFFDWLAERRPDLFWYVIDVEEAIRTPERAGVMAGEKYDSACQELARRFIEVRVVRLAAGMRIWLQ